MGGEPSKILPSLVHGGANVLKDPNFYSEHGVTHALSICNVRPPPEIGLRMVRHINEADMPNTDLSKYFEEIIFFIHEARTSGGACVYVHCAAGVSRSSTAVCAYLIGVHGLTFAEALQYVRTRREVAFPNPGFTAQLRRFERDPQTAALRAKVREAFPHDSDLVAADLREIREALDGIRARLAAGDRTAEPFDPRDRILEMMQQMQDQADQEGGEEEEEEEHDEYGKGGEGEEGEGKASGATGKKSGGDNNGWGLTWIEEERDHRTRSDELPR